MWRKIGIGCILAAVCVVAVPLLVEGQFGTAFNCSGIGPCVGTGDSRSLYLVVDGVPYFELSRDGVLTAINGGSIDGVSSITASTATTSDLLIRGQSAGRTWVELGVDVFASGGIREHGFVAFDDMLWAIGGFNGTTASRKVYYSHNGSTWTEKGTDALPVGIRDIRALNFDGKMWVFGGYTTTVAANKVATVYNSEDGETWTHIGNLPEAVSAYSAIVFNDKMWVIGGQLAGLGNTRKVHYSTDGANWTEAGTDALPVALRLHDSTVFLNKMWVVGGYSTDAVETVYSSTDGITWTEVGTNALAVATLGHVLLAHDGQLWLIGGANSALSALRKAYTSPTGVTWTEVGSSVLWDSVWLHRGLLFNGRMVHLGGLTGSGTTRDYIQSDSGVSGVLSSGSSIFPGSITFALLDAGNTVGSQNGQFIYCTDCTKATPCGSGGNGAIAKRLNNAWDCD